MNTCAKSKQQGPISIGLISGPLELGGAEQQLYHLLRGLDRSDWAPVVIEVGGKGDGNWCQAIRELDIPLVSVHPSLARVSRLRKVATALRYHHVRLVHAWLVYLNPYAAIAGRWADVPVCCGSVREDLSGLPRFHPKWLRFVGLDLVVANWAGARTQMNSSWLRAIPIQTVHNGVVVPEELDDDARWRLRSELGLTRENLVVGAIGRCDRNKRFDLLLEAFALLAVHKRSARLVIIGDGPLRGHLEASARERRLEKRVILPGSIPNAARYLSIFDICCLTSDHEGLPNVLMEAAAAGVPVVATKCGGTAEIVEPGVTGYLVSPGDSGGVAGFLKKLGDESDQREVLGAGGRAKMQRQFSVAAMVSKMVLVYRSALSGGQHAVSTFSEVSAG